MCNSISTYFTFNFCLSPSLKLWQNTQEKLERTKISTKTLSCRMFGFKFHVLMVDANNKLYMITSGKLRENVHYDRAKLKLRGTC